ncbi:MAG: DNA mismatch repair endonuclease MutL [Legionellaceae bacterium]|nr:DNA mismatch repair endonuclease MutL [Legionellaceae bacterium]
MRIQTLSPHVANQIAAGEVIERPASVVKELIENALDAGAKNIDVEIGFGGLNQIKVSDDGEGILAEDLPLAIASHATSKLKILDDLYVIQSMGFRGEALASICSVAHVFIQSHAATEEYASGLECDEQGIRLVPCARNQGTTIEVRDLFFNAPVRKKFLKSETQEYQAIEQIVKRVAFSKPEVALILRHNGKVCLQLPAAPSENMQRVRLTKLLGKSFVDEAVLVDMSRGQIRLHGWVSGPKYARSQQDKIWFYINQRMVRDKLILHALKQAYADILPPGRYPACVLFLTLPLDEVDINVHPSKSEVRFSDARAVHDMIRLVITEMLATHHSDLDSVSSTDLTHTSLRGYQISESEVSHAQPWITLNSTFAVLMHEREAYLIHVERLHRLARLRDLKQTPFPWRSRPLLVPILLELPPNGRARLINYQVELQNFGLTFDDIQEHSVRVCAIPCALPGLDLTQFLSVFCTSFDGNDQNLLDILIHSERVNLMAMTEDEQHALIVYWKNIEHKHSGLSIRLNSDNCCKVLDCA